MRLTRFLSSFPIDLVQEEEFLRSTGSGKWSKITDPRTGASLLLLRQPFVGDLVAGACRFLRAAASPLVVLTPTFQRPIDGWNVRVRSETSLELFFVTKHLRPISDFKLTATEKQIILYGIARGFQEVSRFGLSHGDLRINDIFLDERRYPVIARLSEIAGPPSLSQVRQSPASEVVYIFPWRVLEPPPREKARAALICTDEWSFAMILYQLVVNPSIEITQRPGESCIDALGRGERPPIGPNGAKWADLLGQLWQKRSNPYGFAKVVAYLENPAQWLDGVDPVAFWAYKGYLDYEASKWTAEKLSGISVQKLYQRESADPFIRLGTTPIERFARFVEWLSGPTLERGHAEAYGHVLRSLQEKGALDPLILASFEPLRSIRTFLGATVDVRSAGTRGTRLKRVAVRDDSDPLTITRFLKEVIGSSLGHPALLPAIGWNVYVEGGECELCLLTDELPTLDLASATQMTEKMIIIYGVARALRFLHSVGVVHGDLRADKVFVKDGRPLVADLSGVSGADSPYKAPEVRTGCEGSMSSDVYSFSVFANEVLRSGASPPFPPEFEQFVSDLKNENRGLRLPLATIVSWLEDHLPAGVDPVLFGQYRGFLDAVSAADAGVARTAWLTGLTRRLTGGSAISAIGQALSTAIGDSGLSAVVVGALREAGRLSPERFSGFVPPVVPQFSAHDRALAPLLSFVVPKDSLISPPQSKIGQGAFGEVYLGNLFDARVAVKKVSVTTRKVGNGVARLPVKDHPKQICVCLREILTQVYCAHPAVLKIHGWNFDLSSDNFVIATEYMAHSDASQFFMPRRTKQLTATERQILMYGSARALEWCFSRHILHRDIKLENIMLDAHKRPRIGDFGMAKMNDGDEHTAIQGTPIYMAPEHITRHWSFPGDVFAFGITCAMIATNAYWMPPGCRTAAKVMHEIRNGLRPDLQSVPPKLAGLIAAMFDGNAESRPTFPTIAESLEDPEFWLDAVDAQEFGAYVAWLREEQAKIAKPPRGLAACLERAMMAPRLIERIDRFQCDSPTEMLTSLMASMASDDPAEVDALNTHLTAELEAENGFVRLIPEPAASEELIPLEIPEEAEEEFDQEADGGWPAGDAYHLKIVREGVPTHLDIILAPGTTVAGLHQKLGQMFGGAVRIRTGRRDLAPDATDPLANLGLGNDVLVVTL